MYKRERLPREKSDHMICDFCAALQPEWVYAGSRMSTGEVREAWRWAACTECAEYIERQDWIALRVRMTDAFLDMLALPRPLVEKAIGVSLQEFFNYAVKVRVQ